MHGSNKHSTLKGILLTVGAWCRDTLHRRPYKAHHKMHGRPDDYKDKERETIRRPPASPFEPPSLLEMAVVGSVYDTLEEARQTCTGNTQTCPDPECYACGERDCPFGEPLHYHHDGCPACTNPSDRQPMTILPN